MATNRLIKRNRLVLKEFNAKIEALKQVVAILMVTYPKNLAGNNEKSQLL